MTPSLENIENSFDEKFKEVWNSKSSSFVRIPDGIKSSIKNLYRQQIQELVGYVVGEGKDLVEAKENKLVIHWIDGFNQHLQDCKDRAKSLGIEIK